MNRDVLFVHLAVSHSIFLFAFSITSTSFNISCSDLSVFMLLVPLKEISFLSVCKVIFHSFG